MKNNYSIQKNLIVSTLRKGPLFLLSFLFFTVFALAQSPGQIYEPGVPAITPLDPNGDGWITTSGTNFVAGNEHPQFEIPFIEMPQDSFEPTNDLDTGPSCGTSEIVSDLATSSVGSYYAITDSDAIPNNGDELILFRMRLAGQGAGAYGYSFLIDTDNLIGPSDPNSIAGNPGFEIEVIYNSSSDETRVYNVDGVTSGALINVYGVSNYQRSDALNTNCTGDDPIFLDFYVPLADTGLLTTSSFKVASATSSSPSSALGGSASDIAGVDDNAFPADDDAFIAAINAYNSLPTAVDDSTVADIVENSGLYNIDVLTNDDFGGDGPNVGSITVTPIPIAVGSALLNDGGTPNDPTDDTIDFIPAFGYFGPVSIDYTITDADGDTSTATVTFNVTAGEPIVCGPINTLYQTVGNAGLGVTDIFRYNNFQQSYVKVGELEGVNNNSATNSAYNAATQYIYSSIGGSTIRVYDPASNFSHVGDINITGNSQNFNHVLFSQGNFVGFVNGDRVIRFDVTNIGSYPATVPVNDIGIAGSSGPNDYSLIGDNIYGVTGSTLRVINLATNTLVDRALSFDESLDGIPNDGSFGAAWQDRNGNFYCFNNGNGAIYKIADVVNPASTVAVKILLANPSGQNDGFGCELGPDPLDWDEDGISNNIDIDDDNDGILDVNESDITAVLPGLDPGGDADLDGIFNFRDTDIAGYIDLNGDTINDNFDFDLDGIPDAYDLDSDNDGVPDNIEAQVTNGYVAPTGLDGDNDGLDDAYDTDAVGGFAVSPPNTDGTSFPDFLDVDADDDGFSDTVETGIVLLGTDVDFDGLDDAVDTDLTSPIDPNGNIDDPTLLPDADGDILTTGDADYREAQDIDNDGVQDGPDLDDDNDGILDTAEYGVGLDPFGDDDGDGLFNYADVIDNSTFPFTPLTDVNGDGVPDAYDFDLDGIVNHLDTDSDGDGCSDANEAYGINNADTNGDGTFGAIVGPGEVNPDGTVILAGYTAPVNLDSAFGNTDLDYLQLSVLPDAITLDPTDESTLPFTNVSFTSTASTTGTGTAVEYQWQEQVDGIGTWNDIVDDGTIYSGATTTTLDLTILNNALDGNLYRLVVSSPAFVCDTDINSAAALLTVLSLNNPPVATDDDFNTNEDVTLIGNIITGANGNGVDSDPETDPLEVSQFVIDGTPYIITSGSSVTANILGVGDVTIASNGTLTFVPAPNYNGPVPTITYTLTDGLLTDTAAINITITAVNDTPLAVGDTPADVLEDSATTNISVLVNDSFGGDGSNVGSITVSPIAAVIGTAVLNDGGTPNDPTDDTIDFTPAANYNGPVSIDYTITDLDGDTSTETVTFNVTSVNDLPLAVDDTPVDVLEDSVTTNIAVLGNDSFGGDGPNVGSITVTPIAAAIGTAVLNDGATPNDPTDDTIDFTPAANYNGPVSIDYTITDSNGDTSLATVTFNVTSVNDLPVAVDDTPVDVLEDSATTNIAVLGNDSFGGDAPNIGSITVSPIAAAIGTAVLNDGGTPNDPTDDTIDFTPAANYNGPVSIDYTITDLDGDTSLATVTFNVTAVNDAPIAENNAYSGNEDTTISGNIITDNDVTDGLDSDIDSGSLEVSEFIVGGTPYPIVSGSDNTATIVGVGAITIASDGTLTFVPVADYNGPVPTITYTLTDGALTDTADVIISVIAVNDVPVADDNSTSTTEDIPVIFNVTSTDTDIDGTIDSSTVDLIPGGAIDAIIITAEGTWTVAANGDVTFSPVLGYVGTATLTYTVNDNDGATSNIANLSVTVTDEGNPVANDDSASTTEDTLVTTGNVLTNDSVVDNATITGFDALSVNGGTVSDNGDGTFDYTPVVGFVGVDTFTYTLCDDDLPVASCSTATVTITVTDEGNPVANDDSASTTEDTLVTTGNVLTNDSVVDGATITSSDIVSANGGTVLDNGDGTFDYTPALGFAGIDTFTYTLCDDDLPVASCSTATVTITVTDAGNPTAVDDNISITEDTTIATVISALSNDSLIDGATYSIGSFIYTGANGATIIDNLDGTFDYTPAAGFSGLDSFSYTICDDDLPVASCSTATVFVTVLDEGNPFAVNDTANTILNTPVNTGNVLINDTVIDNAIITSFDALSTNGGIVTDTGGGTFLYSPPAGFIGIDTFTYTLCDDDTPASCSTATVTITVDAGSSDLVTGKTVSAPLSGVDYVEGETITYTLTVTNNGPSDATGVSLVDLLPAGVTYVSDDSAGAYNSGDGNWTIGDLANTSVATLNITATVDVGTGGQTITNVTTAAVGDQSDPDVLPDDLDEPITVGNSADIVLTKVVDNATPNVGDTVTYTVTVTNNGPAGVTGLVVVDALESGLTFGLVTPSVGIWTAPNWSVGNLASGATETITIEATVDAGTGGQTLTNTVSNSQDQIDPDPLPASVPVTVTSSDLVTSKVVDNSTPNEGDPIVYTLTVTNNGPNDATGVSLSDVLPIGVTYVSDNGAGAYNNGSGLWTIGDLAVGATTLEITATVDSGTYGQTITNFTTAAAGDQEDPDTTTDDLDEPITVGNSADIVLTKVVDNATPNVGDTVTYTVTVTNNGPAGVTGLVVVDALESGLTFGLVTPSVGIWTAPNWTVGNLASGATETITIEATVDAGTGGQVLTNTVSNSQDQIDPDPLPASVPVTVTSSDLVTSKVVDNSTPNEGDPIVYTLTVTNNGPNDATGVSLSDVLPIGVTYVSDNGMGAYNNGSGLWSIGDLAVGATTLEITATVDSGTYGQTITNFTTAATGDQEDPDTTTDDLDEPITVGNSADIVLTKVVDNATPNVGDTVTYTVTVTNNGPAGVTGLVVVDALESGLTFGLVTPSVGIWTAPNWTVGNLASGATETITIEATVDAGTGGQVLTNTVSNSQDQIDPDPLPASVPVTVTSSDLVTSKVVDNSTPNEGDTIVYTLTVTNNGPSDATGVSLVDLLPAGVTYVSDDSAGAYNSGDGNWTIGNLSNTSVATLNITATVDVGTGGQTITNITTAATGDQSDPDVLPDDLDEPITVNNDADVILTKVVDNATPNEGDTVTYTITATNNGPASATSLVVTDTMDPGLTFVSATPSNGTYTNPSWTIGSLANGQTETLTIIAIVDAGTGGQTLNNSVINTQDQTDPTPVPADVPVTVTSSDLVTEKTVDNSTPNEGDTIVYTLTVTNNGPSDATGVSLVDLLPAGVTYVSDDVAGAYNSGSGLWTIGSIANGAAVFLNITATVNAGTGGQTITNITTAATGDQSDPDVLPDDLDEPITVNNDADVVLTKVVDNATPNEGDTVTYTITATNNGPAAATSLVITDVLPVGLTFGLVTPSNGIWSAPNWTIGNLANGVTETIIIEAVVGVGTGGQTLTNSVINTQDQTDPNPVPAVVPVTVTSSDLVTAKTVDNSTPNEGDTIVYTLTVTNNGPSDATGVSLVDLLPAGVTYVSDDSAGAYNSGDGNWTIGDLANTSVATLNITATVDVGTSGDTITNFTTAAVGDQSDPDVLPDDLDEPITVNNDADVVLTKVVDNATPNEGDTVTYTITATNNGPAAATSLVVTDTMDSGLTFVSATPSNGTYTNPSWTIGSLANGQTETLTITATVDAGTGGQTLNNSVINTQDQTDPNPVPADVPVTVTSSDLVTAKTVDNATPNEGDTIVYTLTVTNNGPSDATGVSLVDLLPAGVTYVSDDSAGAYNSGDGNWTIGNLSNTSVATLNITATVDVGTGGQTITNITTAATGDQSDPGPGVDDLDEPITVNNEADVVLTKVVDNATPNEGDTVIYTITATNNGPAAVTSLVITDVLPVGLTFGLVTPSNGIWSAPNWTIGNLANGVTETITIEAVVGVGTGGQTLTNSVINTQDQIDPNPVPAVVPVTVTSSDLVTAKTVDNSTPNEGDTIVYTLTVTNNGPSDATGVSLTDNLPLGVSYDSHSTADGSFNSGSGIWTIGNILNGSSATLTINATVDAGTGGQTITNITTAATGDQSDPDVSTDDLDEPITVIDEADIVLTKVVDNSTPDEGDTVTYTVTVTNNGLAAVTNLVVTDALPAGLTYGTVTPSIGTWAAPAWNIGTLGSGATESITIEAIVGLGTRGLVLTNVVSNTQDQIDSNLTPDDDSETITVTSVDLITVKTVNDAAPNEGDLITYTITVTNALGGSDATNVNLVDVLPVGVTYASHSTVNGSYNTGSGLWSIGDITSGNSAVLTINATVDAGTVGQTIVNTTTEVIADQADYDTSNNIGSVAIIPVAIIDLSLTKTVVDDVINPEVGDVVTFEIRVSNDGPTEATGVQVTDLIPSGYDFVNYSSSIGTYNPLTGLWDIGVIEIGNTAILLVDVIVLDAGDYLNCAEVTAANEDDIDSTPANGLDTEDDYDCAEAAPLQEVDLAVEKTVVADNLTPLVDTEVTFEIRLVNNGDIDATEVIVTDLLPSGYTFLNYSSTRGTYDDTDGTWNVGTIVNGETEILLVDAIVNATGDYLNCATITNLHQIDINTANNTSCIATSPISVIDLELTKDVDNLEPYAETNVDFTINLTNNGPSDATGVVVADLLPSGYTFVSYSATTGTYDDVSGLWNVSDVINGETETLIVTAYVLPVGDWTNVAEVINANELDFDSTPGNNDIYEDDQAQVTTDPIILLTVPEGFSPDGDGINDTFEIEFLEVLYPNFSMEIVNRYGNLVYKYEHNGNPNTVPTWWDGFSTGRWNLDSLELPVGTYFYTIYFNNDERKPQTGWVYLRR